MKSKIKYGLIGCGAMNLNHIRALEMLGDETEVTALCDTFEPNLKATQRKVGNEVALYEDYEELLEKADVDAVVITTPNNTHKDIFLAAVGNDKHILIEKPLATTVEDCVAMVKAAENHKKTLQFGTELRFEYGTRKIKELISSGAIGEPAIGHLESSRRPFLRKVNDWIVDKNRSGGAIVEKAVHYFDLFNWWIGSPVKTVYASGSCGGCYKNGDVPADARHKEGCESSILDNAAVTVAYDNGCVMTLSACLFSITRHPFWIVGEKGRIESEKLFKGECALYDFRGQLDYKEDFLPKTIYETPMKEELRQTTHGGLEVLEHQYFIRSIRGEAPAWPPIEEAYAATLIALAAEESIRTGSVIDFKEFNPLNLDLKYEMPDFKEFSLSSSKSGGDDFGVFGL